MSATSFAANIALSIAERARMAALFAATFAMSGELPPPLAIGAVMAPITATLNGAATFGAHVMPASALELPVTPPAVVGSSWRIAKRANGASVGVILRDASSVVTSVEPLPDASL